VQSNVVHNKAKDCTKNDKSNRCFWSSWDFV